MKKSRWAATIAVAALAGFPSLGCQTMKWLFDDWNVESLGAAYHENMERMIANPEVVDAESQPSGPMDGATADQVVEGYRARQSKPPMQRGPSIINIGTGASR